MKTELTLSIEQEIVEAAEKLAVEKGSSLSEVVETHLKNYDRRNGRTSLARQLFGSAEGPLSLKTDQEIWEEMMEARLKR